MNQRGKPVRFDTADEVKPSTLSIRSARGWLTKMFRKMKVPENWRKPVFFVCVIALVFDPLFLFIPVIDSHKFCFTLDMKLGATVVVLGFFSRKQRTASLVSKEILKWVMFCQYIPRIIRIYPISKEVTRASGTVAETKWVGATLNLFLYLLPSHVIGAFWYLCAIENKDRCWREACAKTSGCNLTNLLCARGGGGDNSRFLNTSCPLIDPDQITNSTVFNFGMYIDALKSGVVESRDFPRKFFYCFWWGLRNLSALGQNLETSNSVREIIFAIVICVSGVLLFAVLIGNVQKYLQATTIRADEWEEKQRDTENWMSYRMLPENLKERIWRYEHYQWKKTRGTKEEALLRNLPKDLRLETKRHFYLRSLKQAPWLRLMDDGWLVEALCDRVKPVFYSEGSYIVREGDPVEEMLIVTKGTLRSSKIGFECYGLHLLGAGDICGDLLFWVLDPSSSSGLPTSNRTVITDTDVEGFTLSPDDLTFVASHINRFHSAKLKYMFRFLSAPWQLWAACYIQAAWRAHRQRKVSKSDKQHVRQFSRFFSKALRNRRDNLAGGSSSSQMLPLVPHKPADPEFSNGGAE